MLATNGLTDEQIERVGILLNRAGTVEKYQLVTLILLGFRYRIPWGYWIKTTALQFVMTESLHCSEHWSLGEKYRLIEMLAHVPQAMADKHLMARVLESLQSILSLVPEERGLDEALLVSYSNFVGYCSLLDISQGKDLHELCLKHNHPIVSSNARIRANE